MNLGVNLGTCLTHTDKVLVTSDSGKVHACVCACTHEHMLTCRQLCCLMAQEHLALALQ